ncbi:MAG: thioredoxin family protein [Rhodospirillaceae bacterium]
MMGISWKRVWLLAILACAMMAGPVRAAAPLPMADDLARIAVEASERRVPVLLAFMQRTCPYCARARRHLEPLQASAAWSNQAIMLEIDVDSTERLRDFEGKLTTAQDFARRQGVRMVPTIIVFDQHGRVAADPVIGIASDDFYTYYVEEALKAAAAKVKRGS